MADDLLTWLRLYWRQNTTRTKWINRWRDEAWPANSMTPDQAVETLIGPQKQPASVRQIEAQAKSVAHQLADAVQAQSRDLTSKTPGAARE
jgi:hypothetical protein